MSTPQPEPLDYLAIMAQHGNHNEGRQGVLCATTDTVETPCQPYRMAQTIAALHAPAVIAIETRTDMDVLAASLGVRPDWHEPDERNVSARIVGDHLDNAMGSSLDDNFGEFNVVVTRDGTDVAVVNLATLLSLATTP